MPSRSGLVFIGGSGIRSKREDAIKIALEDAARKASIFYVVEGNFIATNTEGSGFFDFTSEIKADLSFNEDIQGYLENLDFDPDTDVLQYENSLFVRAKYKAGSVQLNYTLPAGQNGKKPGWVDNPPTDISGYYAGVGFSNRRATLRDTVNVSFENAVFAIIKDVASNVSSQAVSFRGGSTFDYRVTNESITTARGVLSSFYVLDTWIDTSNMTVWTLAIARVPNL
jgi:hypothetical protein